MIGTKITNFIVIIPTFTGDKRKMIVNIDIILPWKISEHLNLVSIINC